MSKDILLYETGNGGDILILNDDIATVEALYQQVYILLFGGNVEAVTTGSEVENQPRLDWWANELMFTEEPDKQFNSRTERTLDEVAINSSGRIIIEKAINEDLKSLKKLADISINVVILSNSKLRVSIILIKPNQEEDKILQFIWDNAEKEVIIEQTI